MLFPMFHCFALLLAAGATCTSAQNLPVIDLGKSVHRAQLNVSNLVRLYTTLLTVPPNRRREDITPSRTFPTPNLRWASSASAIPSRSCPSTEPSTMAPRRGLAFRPELRGFSTRSRSSSKDSPREASAGLQDLLQGRRRASQRTAWCSTSRYQRPSTMLRPRVP